MNSPTHRFPPPVREPLHKGRLLDTTFSHAGGDRRDPVVDEEEEPHQYLRPDIQQDSGSEHSFRSNVFLDNISLGKTFQIQPTSRRGETSSHRSNSSHGNGFNNSHVSRSVRSHGSSPDSLSEIVSDRAESVGSAGSRNHGMGRLVTVSQSGSEGSERKTYPALNQVRPLGGQSDDESF